MPNHLHLKTPPPLPLPRPAVPRGNPLPLGMPRALPAPAVPRVREGAGVEYFEETLEDWGGCSTKDVSFVLFEQISTRQPLPVEKTYMKVASPSPSDFAPPPIMPSRVSICGRNI